MIRASSRPPWLGKEFTGNDSFYRVNLVNNATIWVDYKDFQSLVKDTDSNWVLVQPHFQVNFDGFLPVPEPHRLYNQALAKKAMIRKRPMYLNVDNIISVVNEPESWLVMDTIKTFQIN